MFTARDIFHRVMKELSNISKHTSIKTENYLLEIDGQLNAMICRTLADVMRKTLHRFWKLEYFKQLLEHLSMT